MSYIIFIKVFDNISNKPYYFTPRNVYGVSQGSIKDTDYFLLPPKTTKKNIKTVIEEIFINKLFKKNMPYKDLYNKNKNTGLYEKKTYVVGNTYWNGVLYKTNKKTGVKGIDEGIQDGSVTAYEIHIDITTILPGAKLKERMLSGCDYHKRVIKSILTDMTKKYFVGGKKHTRRNRLRKVQKKQNKISLKKMKKTNKRKTQKRCVKLY